MSRSQDVPPSLPPDEVTPDHTPKPESDSPGNPDTVHPNAPAGSSSDLPTGLPQRYQMRGRVGRGGMGEVLCGQDVALSRDLALKVLLADRAANPAAVERFQEEARIGG